MKIKQTMFKDFLDAVEMGGKETRYTDALLQFTDKGLVVNVMIPSNVACVQGVLKTEAFTDYEALGNVPLNKIETLKKVVERFDADEELTLSVQDVYFVVTGSRSFKVKMVDAQFVTTNPDKVPELPIETSMFIRIVEMESFQKDLSVIGAETFDIITEDGSVTFTTSSSDNKLIRKFNDDKVTAGIKVKFGICLLHALHGVKGDVKMMFSGSDQPVSIKYQTDVFSCTYLIAPRVENGL